MGAMGYIYDTGHCTGEGAWVVEFEVVVDEPHYYFFQFVCQMEEKFWKYPKYLQSYHREILLHISKHSFLEFTINH